VLQNINFGNIQKPSPVLGGILRPESSCFFMFFHDFVQLLESLKHGEGSKLIDPDLPWTPQVPAVHFPSPRYLLAPTRLCDQ